QRLVFFENLLISLQLNCYSLGAPTKSPHALTDPLEWWAKHEHDFPNLGKMARDILAVPASGAGVERLFNIARDICNFRRGRLHGETIRKLMKMRHHDHDVLQQELRPTDPDILAEL